MGSVWYKPACPLLPIRQSGAERPWKALAGYFLCSPMEQSGAVMVVMVVVCFFVCFSCLPESQVHKEVALVQAVDCTKPAFFRLFGIFVKK